MLSRIACCSILAISLAAQQRPAQPSSADENQFQISGIVLDSVTGQPVHQARVAIAPVTKRDATTTIITGEDGQFAFPNLGPGKYTLSAQKRGYLTQAFNQHDQFSSSIVVGPSLDSSNLQFRLAPESSISGVVSDEAGEPVREAQVLLYQGGTTGGEQGTHVRTRGTTDEEGLYHFGHLPPGKYFVAVTSTVWYAQRPMPQGQVYSTFHSGGYGRSWADPGTYPEEQGESPLDVAYPITFYPGVTEASGATPIAIKSGDRFVADIRLLPVHALRVRIAADDATESGAKTRFLQLQSNLFDGSPVQVSAETRILASGEMEIVGVPPGHYQVEMFQGRGDSNSGSTAGEMDALTSGEVSLARGTSAVGVTATVHVDPGTAVPLQGYLQLYNSKTRESASEQVSGAGEIEFKKNIRPGAYEVALSNSNGEFIKSVSATGASLNGRVLQIKGAGPVKLAVTIARGEGEVSGVALRDGKPVGGVMIVLAPTDAAHNRLLFRRDQSDSDGTFTLRGVVPGKYTLLALENGWELEWSNPAVLKPYLAGGEALAVQQNGKYEVKAKVQ